MFAHRRSAALLVAFLVLVAAVLGVPRPTGTAPAGARYVVRPGDTLWAIAAARYDGDPREAIWIIKERNELRTSTLTPGEELALPP